jgi:putative PIN family toxin of toxin-antitoxin system
VKAVLDANVLISALLAPAGAPAKVLRLWLDGAYELVVSPRLLAELDRALAYPKLRARVPPQEAGELLELLARHAQVVPDPRGNPQPVRSSDPGDDYLIALAAAEGAILVSGDAHLLVLADELPVLSPMGFLERLGEGA